MLTGLRSIKDIIIGSRRFIFLVLLLLVSTAFFYFHLYDYLTLDTIKKYKATALLLTSQHYKLAVTLYVLIFTFMVACAIPCATVLTLIGGFLFGISAIFYSVFCTTLGGLILFLSVRSAIGTHVSARSTGWLKDMEHGFQHNAFNYLLTLRLIPIFPCWISNVAAGVFNTSVQIYLIATTLGILPATIIYVYAGKSLDTLLANQNRPLMNIMLTPSVLFPLLGLAILSLFPVIYKGLKKHS